MNLSEVLNVALPELPARRSKTFPRIHPRLVMREHIEDGELTMVAVISGGNFLYRFNLEQWRLAQLFDGNRSYAEVAETYEEQTGVPIGEEQVREFAASLEDMEFWYKTPLEKSITASQKLSDERRKQAKKKSADLAQLVIAEWDPDEHITSMYRMFSFVFNRWFVLSVLVMFAVMVAIFVGGWSEIGQDTLRYYTFTEKGAVDLAEFWLLFCALGFFHESAHALTCKHYGGGVHKMGFMLIYLSPAFFADITEVYVYGGKWRRLATIFAGIWVELMFCSVASLVWWGTPPGSAVHDFAYKVMLITGIAVILMNLNPLIKLDGYYLFSELIGIQSIKESSTEYLSAWVKKHVFRLPVEVPYLQRRRRWLFVIYALLSGAYSYTLLFAVVRFSYNVFNKFSPDWAFVPAAALAFVIFKARLRAAWRFMKDFYLDKAPLLKQKFTASRKLAVAAAVVLIFLPIWHETVNGRFILEPARSAVIRATVPGRVSDVLVAEGSMVADHAPILRLTNVVLQQNADRARSDLRLAEATERSAQINQTNLGESAAEHQLQAGRYGAAAAQVVALEVLSPIAGTMVTPSLPDLAGSFVQAGAQLAEVDDLQTLKARIFVPEFQIHRVSPNAEAALKSESWMLPIRGKVNSIALAPSELAPGLVAAEKYKGIAPPTFYVATVLVPNSSGQIRPGMTGDAKIAVRRRSIAGYTWETVREFVQRKFW